MGYITAHNAHVPEAMPYYSSKNNSNVILIVYGSISHNTEVILTLAFFSFAELL